MLDWAILIGCTLVVLFGMYKGYRYLRHEPEPEVVDAVLEPSPMTFYEERQPAGAFSASADDIARRVHEHERACERKERAEALLQAVTMGHMPDTDELDLLCEYFDGKRVNIAISTGAWSETMKAIDKLSCELEDLKAAQPTLIVAEMPERVG